MAIPTLQFDSEMCAIQNPELNKIKAAKLSFLRSITTADQIWKEDIRQEQGIVLVVERIR